MELNSLPILIAFVYNHRSGQCSDVFKANEAMAMSDANKTVALKKLLQLNWNKKQLNHGLIWNTVLLNDSHRYRNISKDELFVFKSDVSISKERLKDILSYFEENDETDSLLSLESFRMLELEMFQISRFILMTWLLSLVISSLIMQTLNSNVGQKNMNLQKCFRTESSDLEALLDSITIGVISTDTEIFITYMNKAAGKMCGWEPNKAVGKRFDDVVKLIRRNSVDSGVEIGVEDGIMELHSRGGRQRDVRRLDAPLISAEGKVLGLAVSLQDMTESRDLVKTLKHKASHDALTGLPNRANFDRRLLTTLDNGIEFSQESALVLLDLDGFKLINDSCGHAAGDALLIEIANIMKNQVRRGDFVARLGGDEFAIILHDCDLEQANYLMEQLVRKICEYKFRWEDKIEFVGASAGVTIVTGLESPEEVCARADAACYEAKKRGKRQVCVFEFCDIKL